jgi:hypothetical protein
MPCIIALIVFGILGIFSASQRKLAKEAFDCVFRRVTFRPCNTGFQEKIKGKLLSNVIKRSKFLARMLNKHYELLSWIFFVLMMASLFWVLRGGYNFYVYGSCNGLNQSSFCAFDPKGENNMTSSITEGEFCGITQASEDDLTLEGVDLSTFYTKNIQSNDDIVFIGCYDCEYSRKAYPDIQKLVEKKKTNYIFAHYPVMGDTSFLSDVGYCINKNYPEKFQDFNNYLFTADKNFIFDPANLSAMLDNFNMNQETINNCINDPETKNIVIKQIEELNKTNIYGTPLIFINGKPFVGPKPYRVYRSAVNDFIFF